jgi:hypothetical protein
VLLRQQLQCRQQLAAGHRRQVHGNMLAARRTSWRVRGRPPAAHQRAICS